MNHNEQFREHAVTDREAAELTPLANVREKLLRSAAAWEGMAVRQDALAVAREKRERDKPVARDESAGDSPNLAAAPPPGLDPE